MFQLYTQVVAPPPTPSLDESGVPQRPVERPGRGREHPAFQFREDVRRDLSQVIGEHPRYTGRGFFSFPWSEDVPQCEEEEI